MISRDIDKKISRQDDRYEAADENVEEKIPGIIGKRLLADVE